MILKLDEIKAAIEAAQNILIIQADNPDGDSLGSALALEQILGDMGKNPSLYCGVDIPYYLKFFAGWDRVCKDLPNKIDLTVILDTSSLSLLTQLEKSQGRAWVAAKPVVVLDHHENVVCDIPYANIVCNGAEFVATGELLYEIAKQAKWPLNVTAGEHMMQSILADSLGLMSDGTTAQTYRRLAEMIDLGVNRTKLEEARRALSKMHPTVFQYKAQLIERVEYFGGDNEIAVVTIPEDELFSIGTLYNPAPLILNEMTMVEGVKVGIVLKLYKDKVTGAIRCTDNTAIAHDLAESFGGGGHPYAAGFKVEQPASDYAEIKSQVIHKAEELLNAPV